jgi:hypothetical protein
VVTRAPKKNNQKLSALSRGKATSGAPICNGMITLAKPANSGVAKKNIIIVPCRVNSWLYCSRLTTCSPVCASSPRITIASIPAKEKNPNAAIR